MIYEMGHILTADMKSSEAMILAIMNARLVLALNTLFSARGGGGYCHIWAI